MQPAAAFAPALAPALAPAVRILDIRCPVVALGRPAEPYRCQLLAGHEGAHAVMFCRRGHRTVRTWSAGDPASVREHPAGQEMLPWMRGLPVPAWSEGD